MNVPTRVVIELANVEAAYGPVIALRSVSLVVREGSVTALLGANGAGKSTALKVISGLLAPRRGTVSLDGAARAFTSPEMMVRAGLMHVPEGREVFPMLSVRDNLMMGAFSRRDRGEISADLERVFGYFSFLRERLNAEAGRLSGGQQQMLAIGRALMARPRIMLLDEPSLGLSPLLVHEIFAILRRINQDQGVTLVVVEQNAAVALDLADHGYVLENGRIVLDDSAERLRENADVREFYLGQKDAGIRGERRWKRKKVWR